MTFNTPPTSVQPTVSHTLQQPHQKAGEHLQHAATNHLAAAKQIDAGDHKAAEQHAKIASDHTSQASQHVAQAVKAGVPDASMQGKKAK